MIQTDASEVPFSPLQEKEKRNKLGWAAASTATNAIFAVMTFFGSAFVLFLSQMGMNKTQIGFLLSLLPFFGVVAPFFAPFAARLGYKRSFLIFWGIRKAAATFLLLIPWVYTRFGFQPMWGFVAALVGVFALCRAMAETAWYPWEQEIVPNAIRGKFTAIRSMISNICSLAAVLTAGMIIGNAPTTRQFLFVFAVGIVFGWISIGVTTKIYGGKPNPQARFNRDHFRQMGKALLDRNFLFYLLGEGIFILTNVQIGAFLPLFMSEQVGLSSGNVIYLTIASMVGGVLASYLWGWLADRYGSKPVLMTVVFLSGLVPLLWLLMPRHSPFSFPAALIAYAVQGAVGMGVQIAFLRILFISVIPPQNKSPYTAVYYAIIGILSGISQLFGGRLLDLTANLSGRLLFFQLDPFTYLFLAGILFPWLSLLFISGVRADSPITTRQFARLFLRGNPLQAILSLLRYQFATTEPAAILAADGMGRTRSPLIVEELIESLEDPRFNVRFEAVLALARSRLDERAIHALGSLLKGSDPALGVLAAWALGRSGNPAGIPFLRQGLESPYRSIQAYSARSLGSLRDLTIVPVLLDRLEQETDAGLQTALASTLGMMEVRQAVPHLLRFLQASRDETQRSEVALALARMMGEEGNYIRLLRQVQKDPTEAIISTLNRLSKKIPSTYYMRKIHLQPLLLTRLDQLSKGNLEEGIRTVTAILRQAEPFAGEAEIRQIASTCADLLSSHLSGDAECLTLSLHLLIQTLPHIVNAR